jgi:hypothetical protein
MASNSKFKATYQAQKGQAAAEEPEEGKKLPLYIKFKKE